MASVTFGDELIKDYLVYRGFLTALKVFDSEVKTDRDRGFRPDRIVEHLSSCITSLDLNALREAWSHLEQRVFSRLEHSFLSTARKLENALLRMYLITCISGSRQDKLLDFFEKMTAELQGQTEWKEWFALPFLKNPDENPTFSVFFTRQWQDTMLVSLHNFISVVFQSVATPSLLNYEEELIRHITLQEENEMLKAKLTSLHIGENESTKNILDNENQEIAVPAELMDDFYVIAQEVPAENVGRSIKSLIRNISSGLPTSPILGRHLHEGRRQEDYPVSGTSKLNKLKPRSPSVPPQLSSSDSSRSKQDLTNTSKSISSKEELQTQDLESKVLSCGNMQSVSQSIYSSIPTLSDPKSGFLILSQEEYLEHHSFVTHCKFNSSGSVVASSDMDGVIKIWNASPSPQTLTTIMSKSSVFALEWATKREKLLLHGSTAGRVRLYDTKERKVVGEVSSDSSSSENSKVLCLSCSPTETNFIVSTRSDGQDGLCLWDMRTLQIEHHLPLASKYAHCNCCSFNHNGQLLLAGASDGTTYIFDLRTYESIATWNSHNGPVFAAQFSSDETSCYTMGKDGKFVQWSVNKTGCRIKELTVHAGAVGPLDGSQRPVGKLFAFDNGNHVLTCGPLGGVIYKIADSNLTHALNVGGHNHPISTVDWSTAMDCSTCLCGSINGKITVSTLLTQ